MSFNKKTIRDISLKSKVVLLRADYNVSIKDGVVVDDYRIKESLETINYILRAGASKLIIISHLGRPDGKNNKEFSLRPVAKKLADLLNKEVLFVQDCVGEVAAEEIAKTKPGALVVCENLRFHKGEEINDPKFAKEIIETTGAEVFVQDAFGVAHRAHASTEAIAKLIPSVAGLLLEKEVKTITEALNEPKRPFTAVVGGAKIADKIDVLDKFIDIADCVVVGGALANDFLRIEGIEVGASLVDEDNLKLAKKLLAKARKAEKDRGFNFIVPIDAVVSVASDGKQSIRVVDLVGNYQAVLDSYPKKPPLSAYTVGRSEKILDIGPSSAGQVAGAVKMSKTIVWSGTMGVCETKGYARGEGPFEQGTRVVVEAIIGQSNNHANKPFSIVGGGDTVTYIEANKLTEDFNHVSTGGSASLELIAGHKLPAVEALADK